MCYHDGYRRASWIGVTDAFHWNFVRVSQSTCDWCVALSETGLMSADVVGNEVLTAVVREVLKQIRGLVLLMVEADIQMATLLFQTRKVSVTPQTVTLHGISEVCQANG
jgi:hypothetical protein